MRQQRLCKLEELQAMVTIIWQWIENCCVLLVIMHTSDNVISSVRSQW